MGTIEKKQDEQKQGSNPSVVDAFISALFASAPSSTSTIATTSSSSSPESNLLDKGKSQSEDTPVRKSVSVGAHVHESKVEEYNPAETSSTPTSETSGRSEPFSAATAATKARTAVKRERSLTEEVGAYSQPSKRKIAQASTTTSGNKRYDEPVYQRHVHGRGSRETGSASPSRTGSEKRAYDHHQYHKQHNQQSQQHQQQRILNDQSAPPSSSYRGKAEIVRYHLQAQRGQPASSTYILALEPVDWSTAVAESRMLIRDIPMHMDNWDLLDHFAPYGEIIEVVIKNQLGFVHFVDASACRAAVTGENGKFIKNFKLRLEVCKQKPHFARGNHTAAEKMTAQPTVTTHVHLLVWDHVPPAYVNHIRQNFECASLPTQTSYLANRHASNQEQIIREKVNIGAIAVLNLESKHEQQRTIDLRVLNKSSNENIHYEAYDSISLDDAIAITKIGYRSSRSISKSPPHRQDQTYTVQATSIRNHETPQQKPQPPLDLATIQQLDVNTLATIYDLVHIQLENALAAYHGKVNGQQHQQFMHPTQISSALYQITPTYQQLSQPALSNTSMSTRSFYQYPQYPPSSPQLLTSPARHVPIPLSTEQLGNILSSVNNNHQ
ncbi:hypothetical protein BCR42DRAFT_401690 [Absidia repens]|uniref:RRM domain-containing protein n=1 Tax=Absidia repens TaxID=90262 RepID=A0A1X2J2Y6_9FUNG|nr:hypothetical protein BCR42DRAFT_401690 [Absidia repens]